MMTKLMTKQHQELLKEFYGNEMNREFFINPLEWNQYPEYEKQYNELSPCNSHKDLIRKMRYTAKHYPMTMNTFISAYDYDHTYDIHRFHVENGHYKETPFGLRLKPSNERRPYPYNEHIILDRIFHDFDAPLRFEDKEFMKNPAIAIDEKREYMKKILFEKHLAEKPLQEAKTLGRFYHEKMGLNPIYVYSGKGIHLYILFKPIKLEFTNVVLNGLCKAIIDTFKFKTLDANVFESARKSRILTSRNPKTDYYVKPINPNWSYFEMLDDVESSRINVDVDAGHDNDVIHQVLKGHDDKAKKDKKLQELNRKMAIRKRPRIYANENQTMIANPDDVVKLLQFPCFKEMKYSDDNNLLLVNLLSFTDLKDADDVQDAMLKFWENKGIKDMQKSESGFKRVERNFRKYIFTNNSLKKRQLCHECDDWKRCFQYNLKFNQQYEDKLETYKNGLI